MTVYTDVLISKKKKQKKKEKEHKIRPYYLWFQVFWNQTMYEHQSTRR